MKGGFSHTLIHEMEQTLSMGKQIILFQNQRGYAPVMECLDCGHMPQCHQCDVTLTYHQYSDQLKCHYCGYSIKQIENCAACGSTEVKMIGIGTQKIEEELIKYLGDGVKIKRMDWDTTRKKASFQNIIDQFEQKEIDKREGKVERATRDIDKLSEAEIRRRSGQKGWFRD